MKWNYTEIGTERVRRREERRKLRESERQERERAIYERLPRVAEIEAEQRQIVALMARAVLTRNGRIGELQQVGQALAVERTRLLSAAGLSLEDLDVYYDCPACKDTGWVEPKWEPGQETVEQARKCECLRREEVEDLFRAAGIGGPLRYMNFDAFRLDIFPPKYRPHMTQVLETCRSYADAAASGSPLPGLFLTGDVGTGKTFLATAIANQVLSAGRSVVYATWAEYLDVVRMWRLTEDTSERMAIQTLLEAHLVVLDDLGAEKITEFVAQELFNLINHRMLRQLPTVVSSNLDPEKIEEFYGSRIGSRLSHAFHKVELHGPDLREKLSRSK